MRSSCPSGRQAPCSCRSCLSLHVSTCPAVCCQQQAGEEVWLRCASLLSDWSAPVTYGCWPPTGAHSYCLLPCRRRRLQRWPRRGRLPSSTRLARLQVRPAVSLAWLPSHHSMQGAYAMPRHRVWLAHLEPDHDAHPGPAPAAVPAPLRCFPSCGSRMAVSSAPLGPKVCQTWPTQGHYVMCCRILASRQASREAGDPGPGWHPAQPCR